MSALSHADFMPRRPSVAQIVARLKGLLPNASAEPKPLTPEERAAIREEAGSKLAALSAERDRELPGLAAAEAKALKHLEALRPAYRAAEAAFAKARDKHFRRAHDYEYAEEGLRRQIVMAADPVIDEFMSDVTELFQASLGQQAEYENRGDYYDFNALKSWSEIWTDGPSRFAFRRALLAARNEAEAMKADPNQSNIRERLVALLDALPDALVKVRKAA